MVLYKERFQGKRTALDVYGSLSYSAAILLVLLWTTWIGEDVSRLRSPFVWGVFFVAILCGIFFVRHEARVKNPMIAPDLLRHRPILAANLYNFIFGMGNFGVMAFYPTYFEEYYHYSAELSGFLLTPRAVATIALSIVGSVYISLVRYTL